MTTRVNYARPLEGRIAVVTGASGNLGPVWIAALAEAGATVVGVDLGASDVAGAQCVLEADVRDRDALRKALAQVRRRFGEPTVLVNNAGVDQPPSAGAAPPARLEDIALDDFRRVLDVNLAGAFAVTQVFGSAMAEGAGGTIVNIGSLYAVIAPDPHLYDHMKPPFLKPPAYGASKAALVNLTRYLARLWGPRNVRVNALSPGGVTGNQDAAFREKFAARVALGRLAGPEDLTGPLVFLASDASRYVTGQHLLVDGGFAV